MQFIQIILGIDSKSIIDTFKNTAESCVNEFTKQPRSL